MRKFAALVCLLALSLALAACSIQINLPAARTPKTPPSTAQTVGKETVPPTTQAPAKAPAEKTGQAEEELDTEILGTYEDGMYTNTVLGIQGAFDENWYIATREERMALYGATAEIITDEDLAELLRNANYVSAFYASYNGSGDNVNIGLEKLGIWWGDEEEYTEASMESLQTGLESMGLSDVTVVSAPYTIDGVEHAGLKVHGLIEGTDFYEWLVCIRAGQYMGIITAGSHSEDLTETFLAQFHSYEG